MRNKCETLVKPGEGVNVDRRSLPPTRTKLKKGTYAIDSDAQSMVRLALEDPTISRKGIRYALNNGDNKEFRNAFTSLTLDHIWQPYRDHVTGPEAGVFEIEFDETRTHLVPVPSGKLDRISSRQTAKAIARSNQDVSTHLVCEELRDGKVPVISKDEKENKRYFYAFKEQTDLVIRDGDLFNTIPDNFDSPSRFISSGLQILRTNVFGLPNLIDDVSAGEGITLNPDQHCTAVSNTLQKSMKPYYLPTMELTLEINNQILNPETIELNPKSWASNGNPDNYAVFPHPDIVRGVNEAAAKKDLPVQTNCPAYHSQVTNAKIV